MTGRCRWLALAAGCYQRSWQLEIRHRALLQVALQQMHKKLQSAQEQIKEFLKIKAEAKHAAAVYESDIAELCEDLNSLEIVLNDAQENEVVPEEKALMQRQKNAELMQQIQELQGTQIKEIVSAPPKSARPPLTKRKEGRSKEDARQKKPSSVDEILRNRTEQLKAVFTAELRSFQSK